MTVNICPFWEMKPKSLQFHCSREDEILKIIERRLEAYYDGDLLSSVPIEIEKIRKELRQGKDGE